MSERRTSAIGRPLDPDYGTNRWIAILTAVTAIVAAVATLLGGAGALDVARAVVLWGGSVFLSWALARELDPDAEGAAFVAVGMGLVWVWAVPAPSVLLTVAVLLGVRIVNRTVGPPARAVDSIVVFAALAWAAFDLGAWPVAAFGAGVFFTDRAMRPSGPRLHGALGSLAVAGAIALGVLESSSGAVPGGTVRWVVVGSGALYLIRILRLKRLNVACDDGSELSPTRVRAGMVLTLSLAGASLVVGVPTVYDAGLLWTSMGALGVAGLDRGSTSTR